MKRQLTIVAFLSLLFSPTSGAESIYTMIMDGRLEQASDSLSKLSTAASRDGDQLYFAALLEEDANQAARLLEASLTASVSAVYREDIYYRLAQYYLVKGDYKPLKELITLYKAQWEDGRHIGQISRYAALVAQLDGKYDAAIRTIDKYLLMHPNGDAAKRGEIDKARTMMEFNKKIGARKLLRNLSRGKHGQSVPQALYILAGDAIASSRTDDAVFYYNLLREGYPSAIGLASTIDRMMGVSTSDTDDSRAEQLTGTYYSVQLGVFSEKGNAKRMSDRFKSYDKKIQIAKKNVSGVQYHVVYIGNFKTYSDAQRFKNELESHHGELYQVVAR
ncbi:MAG: SPOR domain-containing protein [bacterium]|nr:SPOR domain-containing protein [bacterium]